MRSFVKLPKRTTSRLGQRGFALIEVLTAGVLLGILTATAVGLVSHSLKFQQYVGQSNAELQLRGMVRTYLDNESACTKTFESLPANNDLSEIVLRDPQGNSVLKTGDVVDEVTVTSLQARSGIKSGGVYLATLQLSLQRKADSYAGNPVKTSSYPVNLVFAPGLSRCIQGSSGTWQMVGYEERDIDVVAGSPGILNYAFTNLAFTHDSQSYVQVATNLVDPCGTPGQPACSYVDFPSFSYQAKGNILLVGGSASIRATGYKQIVFVSFTIEGPDVNESVRLGSAASNGENDSAMIETSAPPKRILVQPGAIYTITARLTARRNIAYPDPNEPAHHVPNWTPKFVGVSTWKPKVVIQDYLQTQSSEVLVASAN